MVQDLYNFEGTNRKWNSVDGTMTFNFGPSLDLGLTHSGASSDSNAKSIMDFDLHLGHTRKEVDLELSLSIGGAESDITNITLAQSSVQARSNLVQLVDEGSTSSKWRGGPLLHPLNALQNVDTPLTLDSYSNMKDPFPSIPSLENPVPVSNEGRKASVKTCQHPGCTKGARGASGRCIAHGGGRRCQRTGCQKGAEGRTVFCKAHGGGRRCERLGCTKSAEGRTDFCIGHGGGRRCDHDGCQRAARGKTGFCIRHGGGKRCKVEECTKSAEGLTGHCIAHGGGRRCQYPDCRKGAQGSTKYCKAHGGGKRCTFLGCGKGAEGSTWLCKGHGGGKRCSFDAGCGKSVHGGTLFCVAHGGGKRCAEVDCTRSARGKTSFCVRHGGGKRCGSRGCGKSAQGRTEFCKAHGGGRRCSWARPCDGFARGKLGLCVTHSAQMEEDKCVHGENNTFMMQNPDSAISKKGKEMLNQNLVIPEGRVHGGGLMAMLRENLVSFEPSVGGPSAPVARDWV